MIYGSVCRQEALEAAISEKDAHLALLEVSGIRTARQAEEADHLHADRRRLMEKLKEEVCVTLVVNKQRTNRILLYPA